MGPRPELEPDAGLAVHLDGTPPVGDAVDQEQAPARSLGSAGDGPGAGRHRRRSRAPPSATSTIRTSLDARRLNSMLASVRQAGVPHAVGHQLADQQLGVLRHPRLEIRPKPHHGMAGHARRHW